MKKYPVLIATLALLLPVSGCGDSGDSADKDANLTVLAAASLTETFNGLATDFDQAKIEASYGSSTDLAEQAADGAPGDVLATADEKSMNIAKDAGVLSEDPVLFARNELVIVTAPGNPDKIESLADLNGTTWVRCADDVPCGRVALELLGGDEGEPASLEPDVKSTLEKVTSGEADAGLVYASDAVAAGDTVERIAIEGSGDAATSYYIAVLKQAKNPDAAQAWVERLTGDVGKEALQKAGFTLP